MWVKSSISNSNSKLLCGSKSYPCQVLSWKVKVWMSQQTGSWQTLQQTLMDSSSHLQPKSQAASSSLGLLTALCYVRNATKLGAFQTEMDEPLSLRVFVDE